VNILEILKQILIFLVVAMLLHRTAEMITGIYYLCDKQRRTIIHDLKFLYRILTHFNDLN